MTGAPLTAAFAFTLAGMLLSANVLADDAPEAAPPAPWEAGRKAASPAAKPDATQLGKLPRDAVSALVRASAAYEYGDLNQVVEAARLITEGSVPATPEQQVLAFRLLGIGLYLTNRPLGAEAAFNELLRRDPHARLDPTTTRPELVAYFESLRHQQLARERSERRMWKNFIPPLGQFQNEDNGRGWLLRGIGFVGTATMVTSYALKKSWDMPNSQSKHPDAARTLITVNIVTGAVLIAAYVYGVVDGLIGYGKPIEENRLPLTLHVFPGSGGLGFTF